MAAALLAGHPDLRQPSHRLAIQAKARIVAGDIEDRSGKRALLNLGHSFGHAIEAEAGLGRCPPWRSRGARHRPGVPLFG